MKIVSRISLDFKSFIFLPPKRNYQREKYKRNNIYRYTYSNKRLESFIHRYFTVESTKSFL